MELLITICLLVVLAIAWIACRASPKCQEQSGPEQPNPQPTAGSLDGSPEKDGLRWVEFFVRGYTHPTLVDETTERHELYRYLRPGQILPLRRQPDNPFDPNAILVYAPEGLTDPHADLGWVPRELASRLAPRMDAGSVLVARVSRVDTRYWQHKLYAEYAVVKRAPYKARKRKTEAA